MDHRAEFRSSRVSRRRSVDRRADRARLRACDRRCRRGHDLPLVDGQVTSIRFWKRPGDGGVHTGVVWDAATQLELGRVTFAGETASGWQQAQLGTPIDLDAGTKYVIGVHTSDGEYGATTAMLAPASVPFPTFTTPPLPSSSARFR